MTKHDPFSPIMNRRRCLSVLAVAAAGSYGCPKGLFAAQPETYTWRGVALGAEASMTLQHPDPIGARGAIEACLAEVARLEGVFSLHRPDSAISRLNAEGVLQDAPLDLRVLLSEALLLARHSDGVFDPTVQPLWQLFATHFATPGADPNGPPPHLIESARSLVGWQRVAIEDGTIRFAEPGMVLTLNGIAQGYITDKVGDRLRERGFQNVLVNMGEQLALGPKWSGEAWTVAIADPSGSKRTLREIELSDGAIATSATSGLYFDPDRRLSHILDPRTGLPIRKLSGVTVIADRAASADGLSTALCAGGAKLYPRLAKKNAGGFSVFFNSRSA